MASSLKRSMRISRRDVLRQGLSLAALGAGWNACAQPTPRSGPGGAAEKKNVLFLIVDDLRPQLGCYGNRMAMTPNIDRLAAAGVRFEHAYVQQAVCSPSRTSLLTGCRPDTTKVYDLKKHFRSTLPDVVTLPQLFKAAGYHTQSISKVYHPGLDDAPSWSVKSWFPDAPQYALKENRDLIARKRAELKEAGTSDEDAAGKARGPAFECAEVPDEAYADGQAAQKAIETLRQIKDKPFFLAVGFLRPHLPFNAPRKYWDLYDRDKIKLPANNSLPADCPAYAPTNWGEMRSYHGIPQKGPVDDELARSLIHGYYAATSYTDAQVGKVIAELDRLSLREKTVIVLVGDHGWKLGEHGLWSKHTNFELDARAPMIVCAPGARAAGKSSQRLVEFVDLYPTLAELCGLELPKHLEGTSFAPLLDDPQRPWKKAAFSQYPRGRVMGHSMRTERWRFTTWQDRQGKVLAKELYDHQADDGENANVADRPENASIVSELMEQMKKGWKAARGNSQ